MSEQLPTEPVKPVQSQIAPVAPAPEPAKKPVGERAKDTASAGYRIVRWIVLISLVAIATIFIIRNFERVEVDWVFGTTRMPMAAVMLSFLLIGLVIGWLVHWFSRRRRR